MEPDVNGDDEFKKFIEESKMDSNSEFIISSLSSKGRRIRDFMQVALEAYQKLPKDDILRKKLDKFISSLLKDASNTINTFDHIIFDEMGDD
jgi:uncharacterized membrane-anchored protein YjiN (DUF445 family)